MRNFDKISINSDDAIYYKYYDQWKFGLIDKMSYNILSYRANTNKYFFKHTSFKTLETLYKNGMITFGGKHGRRI